MIQIEDIDSLKRWILLSLRKFSVSSPDVLATYTISVVNRGESSIDQVRQACLDELETFLKGQTLQFVDLLIRSLEDGSYKEVGIEEGEGGDNDCNSEWNQRSQNYDDLNDDDDDYDDDRGRRRYRQEVNDSQSPDQTVSINVASKASADFIKDNHERHDIDRSKFDRERGGWFNRRERDRDSNRDGNRDAFRHSNSGLDRDRKRPRDLDGRLGFDRRDHDRGDFSPHAASPPMNGMGQQWRPPTGPLMPPIGGYVANPYDPYAPNLIGYGWGQSHLPQQGFMSSPSTYVPSHPYMYPGAPQFAPQMPVDSAPAFVPPPPASAPQVREQPIEASPSIVHLNGESEHANAKELEDQISESENMHLKAPMQLQAAPPSMPVTYHNYGANSYMVAPTVPYNSAQTLINNGNFNFQKKQRTMQSSNQLPENERCTLRCTGIPAYVKEEDLKNHFKAFGHVVELQISQMVNTDSQQLDDDGNGEKKKSYNECLVQFYSAANAKKCFTSPSPVLNNRFIHVHMSKFNIIPPSDVEPISQNELENDRLLLTQDVNPQVPTISQPARKKNTGMIFTKGVTNKWKRGDEAKALPVPSGDPVDIAATTDSLPQVDDCLTTVNPALEQKKPVETEATKEGLELKQNFEQLKTLKQQAEDMLRKKEAVIQNQLEQCRGMMTKLEKMPESDSRASLVHNLEVKIVGLQTQLRTVHDQIEKGQLADKQSPPPKIPGSYYGYRANGGRHSGSRFYGGRNYHIPGGGRGYMGRGYAVSSQQQGSGEYFVSNEITNETIEIAQNNPTVNED